jgi:hypothetical protein
METEFEKFISRYSDWKTEFNVSVRDHERYQRIRIEAVGDDQIKHVYAATIDVQTGGIYLDCRKRKIFAKHVTLAIARPIHTVVKTIWHASIVGPLLLEVGKSAFTEQTAWKGVKNFGHSLADIVRTPYYGLLMTAHHLYGMIETLFSSNSLYESRDRIGALERKLLRVDQITDGGFWLLSACFSPLANIATAHEKYRAWNTEDGLEAFALAQVNFRSERRALFNNCYGLHPKETPYLSRASVISLG